MPVHFSTTEKFWVPHPTKAYVQARINSSEPDGKGYRFTPDDNSGTITVALKDAENPDKISPVSEEQLRGITNVCDLSHICEGALLETTRVRYSRKEIYTNVARIVIALNPFEMLNIYTPKDVDTYNEAHDTAQLPPHVYGIGADAFQGLLQNKIPQAVLISGESGAGKTESTKHVLSYLADVAGNSELAIESKILSTNPILEAFGRISIGLEFCHRILIISISISGQYQVEKKYHPISQIPMK